MYDSSPIFIMLICILLIIIMGNRKNSVPESEKFAKLFPSGSEICDIKHGVDGGVWITWKLRNKCYIYYKDYYTLPYVLDAKCPRK